MLDLLKKLCLINGVSGNETAVKDFIISEISEFCEYEIDNLGSIIAFKRGMKRPKNKLMIAAHMDEVGFIVNGITGDGFLNFMPVGGIDPRTIFGASVKIGNINGVIGGKAVHHLSSSERDVAPNFDGMTIDIGAKDKEEALKHVSIGDFASFNSDFYLFGNSFIKSKAIDDRIGCAMMINLIKDDLEYDTFFAFNVQEEIGLRGSKATTFTINPDVAIVLEATTAADLSGVEEEKRVCILGDGPVVSFMDNRTIYDKELYKLAFDVAKENNIACQTKTAVAGGNDAGSIHISRSGVRTIAVSLPCRYIHTPSCVINESDLHGTQRLLNELLKKVYD